jgi:hypothetical protein
MYKSAFLVLFIIYSTNCSSVSYSPKFSPEVAISSGGFNYYCNIKRLSNDFLIVEYLDTNIFYLTFQIIDTSGNKFGLPHSAPTSSNANFDPIESLVNGRFVLLWYTLGLMQANIYSNDGTLIVTLNDVTNGIVVYDSYEAVALPDGGFVIIWAGPDIYTFYYRFFDANGNALTSPVSYTISGNEISAPCAKALSTTSVLLCFKMVIAVGLTEYQMCDILTYIGGTGSPLTLFNCYHSFRDTFSISMTRLVNGYYAVAATAEDNYVTVTVISNSLTIVKPTSTVSDNLLSRYPEVIAHTDGEFTVFFDYALAVVQGITRNDIIYQRYDSSYNKLGSNQNLNNSVFGLGRQILSAVDWINSSVALCWMTNTGLNDIYYQIFELYTNCKNSLLYIKTDTTSNLKTILTSSITDPSITAIFITNIPSLGNVVTSTGDPVTLNAKTLIDDINYKSPGILGSFKFTYYSINADSQKSSDCTLTFGVCYPSCETCTSVGSNANHYCSKCKAGYNLQNSSFCYKGCPSATNGISYYIDSTTNACELCQDSCQDCANGYSCTTCKDGYLNVQNYIVNNCVTSCPIGYDQNNSTCIECNIKSSNGTCLNCLDEDLYYYQYQCIDSCPSDLTPDIQNICADCTNRISYKGTCYDICPDKTFYNNTLNTCYTCEDKKMKYYNNTCIETCPIGSVLSKNNICITCKSQGLYYYVNECVDVCPFGMVENDNTCFCEQLIIQGIYINIL